MKKLLGIVVLGLLLSGNAYAFCLLGNCEAKERCRDYAKSAEGNQSDAYSYCMEREGNKKSFGEALDDFIKQN